MPPEPPEPSAEPDEEPDEEEDPALRIKSVHSDEEVRIMSAFLLSLQECKHVASNLSIILRHALVDGDALCLADTLIVISSGKRIVVEYDGAKWHQDAERDNIKMRKLLALTGDRRVDAIVRIRANSSKYTCPDLAADVLDDSRVFIVTTTKRGAAEQLVDALPVLREVVGDASLRRVSKDDIDTLFDTVKKEMNETVVNNIERLRSHFAKHGTEKEVDLLMKKMKHGVHGIRSRLFFDRIVNELIFFFDSKTVKRDVPKMKSLLKDSLVCLIAKVGGKEASLQLEAAETTLGKLPAVNGFYALLSMRGEDAARLVVDAAKLMKVSPSSLCGIDGFFSLLSKLGPDASAKLVNGVVKKLRGVKIEKLLNGGFFASLTKYGDTVADTLNGVVNKLGVGLAKLSCDGFFAILSKYGDKLVDVLTKVVATLGVGLAKLSCGGFFAIVSERGEEAAELLKTVVDKLPGVEMKDLCYDGFMSMVRKNEEKAADRLNSASTSLGVALKQLCKGSFFSIVETHGVEAATARIKACLAAINAGVAVNEQASIGKFGDSSFSIIKDHDAAGPRIRSVIDAFGLTPVKACNHGSFFSFVKDTENATEIGERIVSAGVDVSEIYSGQLFSRLGKTPSYAETIVFLYGKLSNVAIKWCMNGGPLTQTHMATMVEMIRTKQKTIEYYEANIGRRAKSNSLAKELESDKKRMDDEEEKA